MVNQNPNQQGIVAGLPQQNDPNNTMGKMATAGGEGVASTGSVNQTADAYRGRIPELQKKYQMTQDLIYLLAMQQLKGEKEASMRSVAMKANVPPETIMAQRDKEVSDLTGAQMKHIAGVGAEAGATQAKQKQQMAQQKMMQGIGGAPNQTQYAAGGGLVSFVNGGQATDSGAVTTGMEKRLLDQGINVRDIAGRNGVDPELVLRVIQAESSGDQNAISSAGATGYMQLMPGTAKDLGVDPNDPAQNVEGGVRYLRQMLDRYDGDVELGLAAYNAGMGNVDKHGGIPPFEETQNYVNNIMTGYPSNNNSEIDTYIERGRNQGVDPYAASTGTPEEVDAGLGIDFSRISRTIDDSTRKGLDAVEDTYWPLAKKYLNWASENPVDAVSLGLIAVPGVGWVAGGSVRALLGLGKLFRSSKLSGKALDIAKGFFKRTKKANYKPGKDGVPKIVSPASTSWNKGRISAGTGVGVGLVNKIAEDPTIDPAGMRANIALDDEIAEKEMLAMLREQQASTDEVPTDEVQEGIASVAQPESKGKTLEEHYAFIGDGDKELTNVDKMIAGLKGIRGSGRGGALSGIGAGLDYEQERTDKANTLEAAKRTAALGAFGDQQKMFSAERATNRRTDVMKENNILLHDLERLKLEQEQKETITAYAIEWAKIDTERFGQAMEPYINQRNKIIERMRDSDDKEEYGKWEGELDKLFVEVRNLMGRMGSNTPSITFEDL